MRPGYAGISEGTSLSLFKITTVALISFSCPNQITNPVMGMGNNISLSLHPETRERADEFFNNLSTGGTVTMPLGDTFWGAYFGMFTDKFGIKWLVNHVNK